MAIIVPHRPRYRDRSLPIYYLSNGQMVLRQRPREVHDPRTEAQLYQRLRMRVASHFLSSFKSIISLGFAPEEQDNFRMVGGYQQALGQLMREGLVKEPGGVRIRTERVQLSSGRTNPMQSLKARVLPGKLHLTWSGELPKRCAMLLVGVWNRDKAKALSLNIEDPISSHELYISIPEDWEDLNALPEAQKALLARAQGVDPSTLTQRLSSTDAFYGRFSQSGGLSFNSVAVAKEAETSSTPPSQASLDEIITRQGGTPTGYSTKPSTYGQAAVDTSTAQVQGTQTAGAVVAVPTSSGTYVRIAVTAGSAEEVNTIVSTILTTAH